MSAKSAQLVIHQDAEVVKQVRKAVNRALGDEAQVIFDSNFEDARKLIDNLSVPLSLVIIGDNTPANDEAAVGSLPSGAALAFIKDNCNKIPIIVLTSTTPDPKLTQLIDERSNVAVVQYDWAVLEARARDLHSGTAIRSFLDVEVMINDGSQGKWIVKSIGPFRKEESGDFDIESKQFDVLVKMSNGIPAAGELWNAQLAAVGDQLDAMLFDNYGNEFAQALFSRLTRPNIARFVRFLFTMGPSRHAAVVEGLRDRLEDGDPWLLQAPMIRQYAPNGNRLPLFKDDVSYHRPINCLIINANPNAGKDDNPNALLEIRAEAQAICKQLTALQPTSIGYVEHIDLGANPPDSVAVVMEALGKRSWHMVHFAGHCLMQGSDAALVLNARTNEYLPLEQLDQKLQYAQFLFISSSHGCEQPFLSAAMEFSIPAMLAHRWRVNDSSARLFAADFYSCLFDSGDVGFKSLEYACLGARRRARARQVKNNIWASPLLLTHKSS
jgi:hypothetical protein